MRQPRDRTELQVPLPGVWTVFPRNGNQRTTPHAVTGTEGGGEEEADDADATPAVRKQR